jgi:hypothetical protein
MLGAILYKERFFVKKPRQLATIIFMANLSYTPLDVSKLISPPFRPSPEAAPVQTERPIQVAEKAPVIGSAPQPEQQEQAIEQAAEQQPADVSQYIEEKKDDIEVPPELQKHGLKPAQSTQSIFYQNVQLPLSDEKILEGLEKPVTSSHRWLAELAKYLLFQAHLQLKKVHGQVVRIIKR